MWMMLSNNTTITAKDAQGNDAITTYLPIDGLGINTLPDSEKYKKGIKENRTGRARTLGIWMSCPDCSINRKFQEFIPNDYGIEEAPPFKRGKG